MALEQLQNGRYRRLRLLGSGGMGEVYLMEDTRVSRQVAIKVIHSESAPYPDSHTAKDAARLFQREAKAIAALDHPNILPLYDFGEETSDSVILTYMVMPFCPEGSLDSWLRQHSSTGMLSLQDISHLIQQIADTLQYAHDHHIIHLDVKPPNFLIRSNTKNPNRPVLLLADFGIARTNIATAASSSRTIRGTPISMAPEQWSSTPVPASDQYSLAVMAYELLTGRTPFKGGMEQLMYQHFYTEPPPPSTLNKQLPPAIDAVVLRALAKKPTDRFPSITAFADAFEQAVRTPPSPVVVGPPPTISNVHATLAISETEARSGTTRAITLPEGQRVNVTISPGAYDGQVIRLHNLIEASDSMDVVVLTIAIKQTEAPPLKPVTMSTEATVLTSYPSIQPSSQADHALPTLAASNPSIRTSPQPPQPAPTKESPPSRSRSSRIVTSLIILLLLIIASVGGLFLYSSHQTDTTSASLQTATASAKTASTQTATVTGTTTSTPTSQNGLYIAGTYTGSMADQTTGQTSHISVHIVQTQGLAPLSGTFTVTSPSQNTYPLNGTVDTQGNFSFTVQTSTAQAPLYFYGAVYQNDYLKGNFCNTNTNSCSANTGGYFLVGPRF